MRHVISNPYHLFVHESYSHLPGANYARNAGDTMSFDAERAFSYRAEVGRIIRNQHGKRAFLLNSRTYSVTTTQHQHALERAIPEGELIFHYHPNGWGSNQSLSVDTPGFIQSCLADIAELMGKAKRARTYKVWHLRRADARLEELRSWCDFYGQTMPDISLENAPATLATLRAEAEARYRVEQAEREEKERIRLEALRADTVLRVPEWIAGGNVRISYLHEAYLRVSKSDSETVETSQGATVPLEHVQRAIPRVLCLMARCSESDSKFSPQEFGQEVRLGNYALHYVTAEGIKVGCHWFEAGEIRRFAALVGTCKAGVA